VSVLVAGTVALDSVETPFGAVSDALGGTASYFATAASLFTRVNVVGVIGQDYPPAYIEFLRSRNIDLAGLETLQGASFRWNARFDYNLTNAQTLDTQLGVLAQFHPKLPALYRDSEFAFLGNTDPEVQLEVREQLYNPRFVLLDTMDYWINSKRDALSAIVRRVDGVRINEGEIRQYTGTYHLREAARRVMAEGPRVVIVTRGEYGSLLFAGHDLFVSPAYLLEDVRDPTGAGDTFAGGFMGYLARSGTLDRVTLRRAMLHGAVLASFAVEDFSIGRLRTATHADVQARYSELLSNTHFEAIASL
jgi:fructose-1-phosphate kinase PfkB-like protein